MTKNGKRYVIGIDTGGTFTDVVVFDTDANDYFLAKAPTTPQEFSIGVMDAIAAAADFMRMSRNELLNQCLIVKHGTTVGTNAIITRAGAKVGFITTKGWEDTTLIGRAIQRVDGLSLEEIKKMPYVTKPAPIVPKTRIGGVYERIDFRGNIVIPMNVGDAKEQIRKLIEDENVEAIGVSLIFSFMNPVHENKIKELINEMYPKHKLFLTFSNELVQLAKEYGRANTVILNCFVGEIMECYLENLNKKLCEDGFEGRLLVMQSSGGTVSWERVLPIRTVSSGPAGGIIGSQYIAELQRHRNVICTDMGGTSFDVALIRDGKWSYEREPIISRWRVMLPLLKVESIGAGGGTIARVDPIVNRMLVGPDSAGAYPGPVCYDAGGIEPTVCDADLLLGFLNPDYFLGGRIKLNKSMAEKAMRDKVANPLGMEVVEAAAGIFTIVNAHMAELIRVCAMGVGLSPEEFTLYAFGGTAGMHVAYYASELNIKKCYIFPSSPVFSAFGIAGADIIQTASFSLNHMMPVPPETLNSPISNVENDLAKEMEKEGFSRDELIYRHMFNMRYKRQVNYHTISLEQQRYENDENVDFVVKSWIEDFEKVYGKGVAYTKAGIELVSVDIDAVGKGIKAAIKSFQDDNTDSTHSLKGNRRVYFPEIADKFIKTNIYDYEKLRPLNQINGPAIIESSMSTIVVPPEKTATLDSFFNVVIQ